MATWRMSFRVGPNGPSMWKHCIEHKRAIITYNSISEIDLTNLSLDGLKSIWGDLKTNQKSSIRYLAYEMKKGDLIYVKQGNQIICKGEVGGGINRAYTFDRNLASHPACGEDFS